MKKFYRIALLLSFSFDALVSTLAKAEEPSWKDYDQLLSKYVKQDRVNNVNLMAINYEGINADSHF